MAYTETSPCYSCLLSRQFLPCTWGKHRGKHREVIDFFCILSEFLYAYANMNSESFKHTLCFIFILKKCLMLSLWDLYILVHRVLILFNNCIIFHHIDTHNLFNWPLIDGYLDHFHFLCVWKSYSSVIQSNH